MNGVTDSWSDGPDVEEGEPKDDDPEDDDYGRRRRFRKRRRTTHVRFHLPSLYDASAHRGAEEKEVIEIDDTIPVKTDPSSTRPSMVGQGKVDHGTNVPLATTVGPVATNVPPAATIPVSSAEPSNPDAFPAPGPLPLLSTATTRPIQQFSTADNTQAARVTSPLGLDARPTQSPRPETSRPVAEKALSAQNSPEASVPPLSGPLIPDIHGPQPASSELASHREPLEIRGRTWRFTNAESQVKALIASRACQLDTLRLLGQDVEDKAVVRFLINALSRQGGMIESLLASSDVEKQAELLTDTLKSELEMVGELSEMLCGDGDKLLHCKRLMQLERKIEDCFIENDGWWI